MPNKNKKTKNESKSTNSTSASNRQNKFILWINKYLLIVILAITCGFGLGYATSYLLNKKDPNVNQEVVQQSAILNKISILVFLNNSIYTITLMKNEPGFPTNPIEITQLNSTNFSLNDITIPKSGNLDDGLSLNEITITLGFIDCNGSTFNAELTKQIDLIIDNMNNQISIKSIQLQLSNLIINSNNENNFLCIFDFILQK